MTKIPYKEKFVPSELPDGIISIPFRYGPAYTGKINGKKAWYTKETFLKALEDERLIGLYSAGLLKVEYINQRILTDYSGWDSLRYQTIDLKNTIGKVYALDDSNLYIIPNDRFVKLLNELSSNKRYPKLRAYARTLKGPDNFYRIITWDIYDIIEDMNSGAVDAFNDFVKELVTIYFNEEEDQQRIDDFKSMMVKQFKQEYIDSYYLYKLSHNTKIPYRKCTNLNK